MAKKKKTAAQQAADAAERVAKKNPKVFLAIVAIILVIAIVAGVCWYFLIYRKAKMDEGSTDDTEQSDSLGNSQQGGNNQGGNNQGGNQQGGNNQGGNNQGGNQQGGNNQGGNNQGGNNQGGNQQGGAVTSGDLSIHFMELGNNSNGDSIYIKAGDTDILIDAGSSTGSATTIEKYVDQYCTDGKLEYVIATHGDTDHIAAFVGTTKTPGIFDYYECETIIDFARTGKNTDMVNNYYAKRDAEVALGAKHYTALQCAKELDGAQKIYELADGITMEILYQKYYETSTSNENDYSVCILFTQGENHYLFLGDLEEAGERSLVENNPDLPEVELYKAGHHGSPTSANEVLLEVIKPKVVCVSCVAGHTEYTQNLLNTFPSQDFINRVARYTDKIYVTTEGKIKYNESTGRWNSDGYLSMNGNITFSCINGVIEVHGSNNDTILKETQWFADNRTWPSYGV